MAGSVLVDSNVLLDVLTADALWVDWSRDQLTQARANGNIIINPIICAEVAPVFGFDWSELESWLQPSSLVCEALPFEASVIAASAYEAYRKRGGTRTSTLPDFFIGAHAQVAGHTLLTSDIQRYRTYFPEVPLIVPSV